MAARHRLQVVLRVPVGVEHDNGVGRGQVDADTARSRSDDEDERLGGRVGEAVDGRLPLAAGDGAVEPLVSPAAPLHEVLDQVEHLGELGEEQDAVAVRLELGQQLVQQDQLARRLDQPVAVARLVLILEPGPRGAPQLGVVVLGQGGRRAHRRLGRQLRQGRLLDLPDEPRVVAAVAEHHRDVVERHGPGVGRADPVEQQRAVLLEARAVAQLLQVGDLDVHERLLERVQALLDVGLLATQQVRLQQLVELVDLFDGTGAGR
mmetsp:Transcript_35796/g.114003  ORF Transcript_35796/g.114003 Transcript_35796/m.114003 type:complete len:263 (-) Transcript_35796:2645-3433(-)